MTSALPLRAVGIVSIISDEAVSATSLALGQALVSTHTGHGRSNLNRWGPPLSDLRWVPSPLRGLQPGDYIRHTPAYGAITQAGRRGESAIVYLLPDSPPDMVGSCLVCFQGVSGCRPGVTHDMIGHRTGSRVPSLRVSAAVRCQLWLFSGQRRHGRAWQLGRVAYKPMLQAGSPMLDTARQPAPISSAAP